MKKRRFERRSVHTTRSERYTVNGVEYKSLDEMPPELRQLFFDADGNGRPDIVDRALLETGAGGTEAQSIEYQFNEETLLGGESRESEMGACPACGYDLRGLPQGQRCPECGGRGTPRKRAAMLPTIRTGDRDDDADQESWFPFVLHLPEAFLRALPWIALAIVAIAVLLAIAGIIRMLGSALR